jgi:DNA-repair protein XRCC3
MRTALERCGYPPDDGAVYPLLDELLERLEAQRVVDVAGFILKEFTDTPRFATTLRLTAPQVHRLTHDMSTALLTGTLASVLDIQTAAPEIFISSGCPHIDSFLKGGWKTKLITEICGASASGKTQLCLQSCLQATLPQHCQQQPTGSAVYIVTEDFPHRRLYSMAAELCSRYKLSTKDDTDAPLRLLDRLYVRRVADAAALWGTLVNLPRFVEQASPPVRVIAIDSIAAVFRGAGESAFSKADQLVRFSALLRRIADERNIAVLIANQVTGHFRSRTSDAPTAAKLTEVSNGFFPSPAGPLTEDAVVPALGLSWSACVNARLMLLRSDRHPGPVIPDPLQLADGEHSVDGQLKKGAKAGSSPPAPVRRMAVLFAPHLDDQSFCEFRITEAGVSGVL